MQKIYVNQLRVYGFHGCMSEETAIGTEFIVDMVVEGNFDKCLQTDRVEDTVDYVEISKIAREEVKKRADLIEVVAHRILLRIKKLNLVEKATVKITKINPPIGLAVESVSFEISD